MPARLFQPQTDIFETSEALTLVLEMPGVDKGSVEVKVENDVLNIEGRVDFLEVRRAATAVHRV
jgi:HSP20 family molecular chaperone IbpA